MLSNVVCIISVFYNGCELEVHNSKTPTELIISYTNYINSKLMFYHRQCVA